jgi:hypothetical protein
MRRSCIPCTVILIALAAAARAAGPPTPLREVPVAHYVIHTDVPDTALVTDLGRRMGAMYDQYGRSLPAFQLPADAPPLPVYLFVARERYASFSRFAGANSGGVFVPGPHPFLASYVDGQTRDELRRTLQHEGFHQFAYLAVSRHLPIWLNEGLAQVFEEGLWDGRSFLMGQVTPRRVRQLRSDLDRRTAIPLERLLAITPGGWASTLRRDVNAGETQYNQAWLLAHYLTYAAPADDRRHWADLLVELHRLDRAGDGGDAASADAFRDCFPNLPELQAAFSAWSRQLRPSDEALLLERQATLGDFLADYRTAGRTFADVAAFRDAAVQQHLRITYVRGLVRHTTDADPGAYFADAAGVPYGPRQLYFDPAPNAPLPDLVCRPLAGVGVRTRFYRDDHGAIGHESSIEAVDRP